MQPPNQVQKERHIGRARVAGNLPATVSKFIGRDKDLAHLQELLGDSRLVTIVGPGGVGKTRLALELAFLVLDDFRDGAWLVDLTSVEGSQLLPHAIAEQLGVIVSRGIDAEASLLGALSKREMLLIFDNFEHVLESAPLVSNLLGSAPRLSVVTTSREPVGLSGEQVYSLTPLRLPDPAVDPSSSGSEAVELFAQRALAVNSSLELNRDTTRLIAEICVRLDGLPLALELAASRAKGLSLSQIHDLLLENTSSLASRLRDRPSRQRTLRDTVEWSYELLQATERRLFALMAVFVGRTSLAAIEYVCSPFFSSDVALVLESLVEKSLVQFHPEEDELNYSMLSTIREYALEQLDNLGDCAEIRHRHCMYYVEQIEEAEPHLLEEERSNWIERLNAQLGNINAALSWAFGTDGNPVLGCRLLGAGHVYWLFEQFQVASQWQSDALDHKHELDASQRALLELSVGFLHFGRNEMTLARQHLRAAVEAHETLGQSYRLALARLGIAGTLIGDVERSEEAIAQVDEAEKLALALEARGLRALALNARGEIERTRGDDEAAEVAYQESLKILRELKDHRSEAVMLVNLSYLAHHNHETEMAFSLAVDALHLALEVGNQLLAAWAVLGLAGPARNVVGDEEAAQLLGLADGTLRLLGVERQPGDEFEYQEVKRSMGESLGDTRLQDLIREGEEMGLEDALTLLANGREPQSPPDGSSITLLGDVSPSAFRTVVFTDVVESTEFITRVGDETGRAAIRQLETRLADIADRHGGTVVKTLGDGLIVAFASNSSALRFALDAQKSTDEQPLRLRIGMAAGEPIEEDGDIHGAVVAQASRITDVGGAGEIVASDAVRQLALGKGFEFNLIGPVDLKGFPEAVTVWRVETGDVA